MATTSAEPAEHTFVNSHPGHRSVSRRIRSSCFGKTLRFLGPGFLIAVGYLDPGNWATDLEAGSKYGYKLLFFVFLSNLTALVVQFLCVKLGVVSGYDLAQACRKFGPKRLNMVLYLLAELAIISTDLAEVIGSAIALNLLFGLSLWLGVLITSADVFVVLLFYRSRSIRTFEKLIMVLVLSVGAMFVMELFWVKPDLVEAAKGFLPPPATYWKDSEVIYLGLGIVGATVMPHNLYLHSNLVKYRAPRKLSQCPKAVREMLRYTFIDCVIALTFAVFVNAAILMVSAAAFQGMNVAGLFKAYELLKDPSTGPGIAAATVFAIALLLSGQSSTLTATLAGQTVMEGFLGLKIKPWVRRVVTRSVALLPAMVVALSKGDQPKEMNQLLILSQVALSLQLPFAVIPLLLLTGQKRVMRLKHLPTGSYVQLRNETGDSQGRGSHFRSFGHRIRGEDILCSGLDQVATSMNRKDPTTFEKSLITGQPFARPDNVPNLDYQASVMSLPGSTEMPGPSGTRATTASNTREGLLTSSSSPSEPLLGDGVPRGAPSTTQFDQVTSHVSDHPNDRSLKTPFAGLARLMYRRVTDFSGGFRKSAWGQRSEEVREPLDGTGGHLRSPGDAEGVDPAALGVASGTAPSSSNSSSTGYSSSIDFSDSSEDEDDSSLGDEESGFRSFAGGRGARDAPAYDAGIAPATNEDDWSGLDPNAALEAYQDDYSRDFTNSSLLNVIAWGIGLLLIVLNILLLRDLL